MKTVARRLTAPAALMAALIGGASPASAQLAAQTGASEAIGDVSSDGLRWTPHRSRRTAETAEEPAAPESATPPGERLASNDPEGLRGALTPGQRAAASVVLDEGLARLRPEEPVPGMPPFAVAAPAMPPVTRAPGEAGTSGSMGPGTNDRATVAGPLRAGLGGLSLPPFPALRPSLPGLRAPQGDITRPTTSTGPSPSRGSLPDAPRFRPAAVPPAARVAVNADGLPSVMAKPDVRGVADPIPSPALSGTASPPVLPQAPVAAVAAPTGPRVPEAVPVRPSPSAPSAAGSLGMNPGSPGPEFDPRMEGMQEGFGGGAEPLPSEEMWMGGYPSASCETCGMDGCSDEECGFLPCMAPSGRFCAFLRQFGQPYYGWKWYRDLTASVGVTSFQTPADLGLFGNYGTNEYLNWSMPFWNAFGIGWQLGVRGVQSNFQRTTVTLGDIGSYGSSVRDQFFLTTGFFTRAFEGNGLQFGAVWDYLQDDWIDNVDVAQIRAEISYVWHAHEIGFWGAFQYDTVPFSGRLLAGHATTYELFNAFYRLQFGDANEWKVWGGASQNGDGYLGTLLRAPMTRSLALEGTFTYLIPKDSTRYTFDGGSIAFTDAAWNISANVVFYPGCRSRRSLASPYRPLFDVADNGTMIRSIEGLTVSP